jgi:hypothetical protein
MRHHVETQRSRELNRITADVFAKHGIVNEHEPVTDPEVQREIIWEISRRFASHALGLPYVEDVPGDEIVARLNAVRGKSDDPA